jgi:16S rRNA (cytosine1407-C5)-methyltransferase
MSMPTSLPDLFIARLKEQFTPEFAASILESYAHPKRLTVRINTLKTSVDDALHLLRISHIPFEQIPWLPHALFIDLPTREITELDMYKEGKIYIQSLSSMIPALVLNPQPEETVLDMTAAPGSKTSQMAAIMHNQGSIVANDNSAKRIFKLRSVLELLGVTNTMVIQQDGQALWKQYPEHFDKVLIDAPCSVEGTFSLQNPAIYSHWTPKLPKNLSKLQMWLLRSAVSCTKPGGTIVYSTCTLSIEENEAVVDWILKKEKGDIEIEAFQFDEIPSYPAFMEKKEKSFDLEVGKTMRILPSDSMEGFFIAKFKKINSTVPPTIF